MKGKDDSVGIDICRLDETKEGSRVNMTYAGQPTSGQTTQIIRRMFPHWLTVSVTADNLSVPVNKTFKIEVTPDGFLTMETSEEGPP